MTLPIQGSVTIRKMKKFDIGLNLDADINKLEHFFMYYSKWINSVYFSVPLGQAYYSRRTLKKEYENNSKKLQEIICILYENNIKTEVTFNTKLSPEEIYLGIDCLNRLEIFPDEIVCLNSSVEILHRAYPKSYLISSFCNGTERINSNFNAVVLGQSYLRSEEARHEYVDNGYDVILLLNNGCSFACNHKHCNGKICTALYDSLAKEKNPNEIYALQSFFPEELEYLIAKDTYSNKYIYKLSTRPMGLEYTKSVLEAYAMLIDSSNYELDTNRENYALFGALYQLCKRVDIYDYKYIKQLKEKLYK